MKRYLVLLVFVITCPYISPPAATALNWDLPHITAFTSEVCFSCHIQNPHHGTASYPAQLNNLCESCHFDGGPATGVVTHSSRTTDNDYGNWDLDCWACHHPHSQEQETWGSVYGKYIRRYLQAEVKEIDPSDPGPYWWPLSILRTVTSDIVEFKGPTEFVDGDGLADDDICQVCHENTHYYNTTTEFNTHADNGPDSQPGGVCTTCHLHSEGFAASGCINCHATAQPSGSLYRRQVAGSGGDFERTSHHVWEGVSESVDDSDCQVCHDQANHQTLTDPNAELNDPDGGAPYTYNSTGASLEGFCLNCHDADGPLLYDFDSNPGNGRQPFSDVLTPTDIDTRWAASAHGVSTVTELATDKCLACHGGDDTTITETVTDHNTHGSVSASLLSGLVAGETVTNSQEGLCFACHDGSPATDIEAMFAGTATATSNSGALNNSHHDVSDADQTYSGAVIECGDCHDPHATGVLADPDPGDGRVPEADLTWTGSTFSSEFCLDCHDNSFPAAVTPPTNPMIDIYEMWVYTGGGDKADQHGGKSAGSNVNLRAGSGYARHDILQCADCHNLGHGDEVGGTAYPNLFNLKSIIYSKDGSTPLSPDPGLSIPGEDVNLVRVTDTSASNEDPLTNGIAFCSTCHPAPMGGNKKSGCLSGNCHAHGENSF